MYKPGYIRLMRMAMGFRESKILLVANEVDLFSHLSAAPSSISELASRLQVNARAVAIIVNALVAMSVLSKDGNYYCNAEIAEMYLVKNKPDYVGQFLKFMNLYWNRWNNLEEVLKTGLNPLDLCTPNQAERAYNQVFIWGMDNMGKERAARISQSLDLSGVRRMLDVGGGAATYSIAFAKQNSELTSVVLDLRHPLEVARQNIERHGLSHRIHTREGSYWEADYGSGYDLVWISQIIHGLSDDQGAQLVLRSAAALGRGGRLIVHDSLLADNRCSPYHAALFSVYMLAITEQGRCYTVGEVKDWLMRAGLEDIRRMELDTESEMVIGTKP